jgi:23S rRNA (pseudouridine1915-N3)-methyltransferase
LGRYYSISYKHFKTADSLIKAVSEKDYKIVHSLIGTTTLSEDLAEKFNSLGVSGVSDLTNIIGTPYRAAMNI